MIKSMVGALALGLAAYGAAPAAAQPIRFDPGLQSSASGLLTQVQAQGGGPLLLPPGVRNGGPGGRPGSGFNGGGGPGPRFGGGGVPGPRFGGGGAPGPRFGGGDFRRGGGPGPRFGDGDGGRRRRGDGFGIGAGIAAGALLGGAIAAQGAPGYGYGYGDYGDDPGYAYGYVPPPPEDTYADADAVPAGDSSAYCARRFKSYDPSSGTYLGYDGMRHPCP